MLNKEYGTLYLWLVENISNNLIILMCVLFGTALTLRFLIYFIVRRQSWFVFEFHKRVQSSLLEKEKDETAIPPSFFGALRFNLEKTYFEIFYLREKNKRKALDPFLILMDRMFMVKNGVADLIMEFFNQVRYLKHGGQSEEFVEKTKAAFNSNKPFGRLFGYLPVHFLDDFINTLPSIFVIGGIFGTFLGIMFALPGIASADFTDVESSRKVVNEFLNNISFAMNTSIVGIIFSVAMTFFNSMLSPDSYFYYLINKFSSTVEIIWNKSDHNDLTEAEVDWFEAALPSHVNGRIMSISSDKILHNSTRKFLNSRAFYKDQQDDEKKSA